MSTNLFDDRTAMKVIHSHVNCHLFDEGGKPIVVKKWKSRAKETDGQVLEERYPIDSEDLTKDCRMEMARAWAEYAGWIEVNR